MGGMKRSPVPSGCVPALGNTLDHARDPSAPDKGKEKANQEKKRFVFTSLNMIYQSMNLAQPSQSSLAWTSIYPS